MTGDALTELRKRPAESVHMCMTSPAYWGLRDYGVAGQLGLERTPEEYVQHLVEVFREVWRVLRPEGTLFLVLGDSYASGKGTCYNPGGGENSLAQARKEAGAHPLDRGNKSTLAQSGLKPKDLVGIPWMVAFALRADGWWLRSDVIWAKGVSFLPDYAGSCMPESVRDRPTTSHEHVFLLSKSADYYWDAEAVKEPSTRQSGQAASFKRGTKDELLPGQNAIQHRVDREPGENNGTRNLRTVWVISPHPYKKQHFATYPPRLVEPCIKAGTSGRGCCSAMVKKLRVRQDLTSEQRERLEQWLQRKGLL